MHNNNQGKNPSQNPSRESNPGRQPESNPGRDTNKSMPGQKDKKW